MASGRKRRISTIDADSVQAVATSEILMETVSFIWEIKNYSTFEGRPKEKSPVVRLGQKNNHSWQLVVFPKRQVDDVEYFGVNLKLATSESEGDPETKVRAKFQVAILNAEGHPWRQHGGLYMASHVFQIGRNTNGCGWKKFCLSRDVTDPINGLLSNDELKLHCIIWIEGQTRSIVRQGSAAMIHFVSEQEKAHRRNSKFARLFDDSLYTDVTIKTTSRSYQAHKAVLSAMSPVFDAMFRTAMTENQTNSVDIQDFDDDIVKAMLDYLYKGEIKLHSGARVLDLFRIADKLLLDDMKKECEHLILSQINVENVSDVFQLAFMYDSNVLKARVIDFIKWNKDAVKRSNTFKELPILNAQALLEYM